MKMKFHKICRNLLVILLVIGLLSSSFGVVVAAVTDQNLRTANEDSNQTSKPEKEEESSEFVSPLEQYGGKKDGEAAFQDNVQVISPEDLEILEKAFVSSEAVSGWGTNYTRYNFNSTVLIKWPEELPEDVLNPKPTEPPKEWSDELTEEEQEELRKQEEQARKEEEARLEKIEQYEKAKQQAIDDAKKLLADVVTRAGKNGVIYLPADEKSVFAGPRMFTTKGYSASEYRETAYLDVSEARFEEAFKSMDICTSEVLKEENLVSASFAPGVSAYFGDAENAVSATASRTGAATLSNLSTRDTQAQVVPLDNKYSTENGDLVVTLDYKLKGEKKDGIETELKLTGSFGIRDLQAHLVCQVEEPLDFQELYCGLSGQVFANVGFSGSVKGEATPEASELDLFLLSFEGLNEKRFPIAVFQFQGTTPVYITNQAFEASREAVFPSLFVLLYADWEGSISVELSTNIEYANSFNSGLSVFKNGELDLGFEEYPYPTDLEEEQEDGLTWNTTLTLEANTDLTLFGGSVVFYIAGVNLAEVGVARIGVEAKCDLTVSGSLGQKLKVTGKTDANAYIRGYLKFLEVKVKLKMDFCLLFENFSSDLDMQFCLADLTLFIWGATPDEYKKKNPVSTMRRPEEYGSVMCLVCDVSGSMGDPIASGQTKLQAAKEAAIAVTKSAKTWNAQNEGNYGVGVVRFSDSANNLVLPHIDYTYVQDCIALMEAGGGTNIYTGIDAGMAQLEATKAANKVIILMTDGQDSYESSTLNSAQAAADAGITIYTIGFGQDVNEDLLTQVAEITGGEYRYANTDSILGIVGSFLYSQQTAAGADILTEVESTVGEGETSKKTHFTVKNKNGDLVVTTAWPGSFLDTILIDPTGREVDEEYPGATTDESQIPSTIVVKDPIPGKWSVQVLGVETSYEQEPFYTIVSFTDTKATAVNYEMTTLQKIAAWCLPIGLVVTMASTMALVGLGKTKKKEVQAAE